ncbi:MAG: ABC transporter permease subunit [Oscillospiraceae bacterium]
MAGYLYQHILVQLQGGLVRLSAGRRDWDSPGAVYGLVSNLRSGGPSSLEVIRPIPSLAWIPIVLLFLGIGVEARAVLIFMGCFVAIVLNTYTGIRSTNQTLVNVAKTCGAGNLKIFWTVGVPSAMPMIFAGLKTSMGSAWGTIVAARCWPLQRPWLHDPDGPLLRGRFTDHGRHHCHWNFRLCVVRHCQPGGEHGSEMEAQEMKTTKNPWLEERGALYKLFYYLGPCLLIIAFLLLWQGIASGGKTMLPTPAAALERLVTIWSGDIAKHPMIYHVGMSMRRVLTALIFSVAVGVPFGIAMGWNKTFRAIFKPLFEVIRPVPPIAWVPLFTLWFGTSEFSRVAIITMGVFMPIVINSYSGVVMVPEINFQVGRVFGARSMDMLFDVVLPSSLNAIFAGIRTALGGGWMVLLASEMLGAREGIGFLIMQGSSANDLTLAIVGMVMIGAFGALFAYGFDFLERWLCPWKRK